MTAPLGYVGRLAPSPTGALHLGNVRTFMIAWLRARSAGGRVIFRMEDLDHPRDKPGADVAAVEDLKWLGFDWDEEVVQSRRREVYRAALAKLIAANRVYPCVCSRRDVERAQSAPHEGEQLKYPGTCRGRFRDWQSAVASGKAQPCWRFRVEENTIVRFVDGFAGAYEQDVVQKLGDFPLARDVDGAGYMLASVVDDADEGVTEVVRGDDLLAATPSQMLIQRELGLPTPNYFHVPLVVGADGKRLAKRHGDTRVATFRAAGMSASILLGKLAATCGWAQEGEAIGLEGLLKRYDPETIPHTPVEL